MRVPTRLVRIAASPVFTAVLLCGPALAGPAVTVREEPLVIPTYRVAEPDRHPRFYAGRTYQGAKATFYPYAVMDMLTDLREDKTYRAVYLENDYLQISVLPELGGRIFSALDKGNQYDFFYRQHVIKPALIGMLGAWISGGVEWNVPHHHRASSFLPVDYTFEQRADGSQTVWVGEIELRHRMKWLVGLTLHPDKSYLEITGTLFNRTPVAHSFLFWINPAVHANTNYQVIFPPSTEWTVQHGKPEFASWPIARQVYGGTDYTRGVDISRWKNHPSPVSFFAWNSEDDFFGGYDHGKQAGVVHVADHHMVPGKKFFEWGNGAEGAMWEKILTDTDGPYLELMAGAYSDNQPDYSWCQPYEVKTWKHYWYPIRELGGVKNANLDAAVNLEIDPPGVAKFAFNATAVFKGAKAVLRAGDTLLFEKEITISPTRPFRAEQALPAGVKADDVTAALFAADGRELIAYHPVRRQGTPKPNPVQRPAPPKDIKTSEELYLTGLRVEQLYSPAFEPDPYYEEALRRDPGDYRANVARGILDCKRGRFQEAEARLSAGLRTASQNYLRPKDVEAAYYLGVARKALGKLDAAGDAFHRAAWSHGWQAASYYALAELTCLKREFPKALEFVDRALAAHGLNTKALDLKAAVCRRLQRFDEAEQLARQAQVIDPLDFRARNELALAHRGASQQTAEPALAALTRLMRGEVQSWLEMAMDYGNAGLFDEAIDALRRFVAASPNPRQINPLVYYDLGYYAHQSGDSHTAAEYYQQAGQMPPDYCFPFRFEDVDVLRLAMKYNPRDARAAYYLGNLLYDHQPEQAIEAWEQSRALDDTFAPAHRNLALAYAQHAKDIPKAIASLEKAVTLNPSEPRFFYELDVLHQAGGTAPQRRLELLARNHEVVARRDDAVRREITLLIQLGQADRALDLLRTRHFHNWEGSAELRTTYLDACLTRGNQRFQAGKPREALADYEAALQYPENLEVGKPRREPRLIEIHYRIAAAHDALGDSAQAKEHYETAAAIKEEAGTENKYYQGLTLRKLGRAAEADQVFAEMARSAQEKLNSSPAVDYFAKFGERQSEKGRQAQLHYLTGLGLLGQGKAPEARAEFQRALEQDPNHLSAQQQLLLLPRR